MGEHQPVTLQHCAGVILNSVVRGVNLFQSIYMSLKEPSVITVIQTRRGSSRLPDKVFLPLAGRPLFVRQAERVKAAVLCGRVVVATTTEVEDDLIEATCRQEGLEYYRGHADDLLDRHYQAARHYRADTVIKIPSDCPLIDPVCHRPRNSLLHLACRSI